MAETGDLGFSPTVRWAGPQTNKRRPEFTGETFNQLREKAAAACNGVNLDTGEVKTAQELLTAGIAYHGVPKAAAAVIAQHLAALIEKVNELKSQFDYLQHVATQENPARLSKLEAQVAELHVQLNLLRNVPPHLKNIEKR